MRDVRAQILAILSCAATCLYGCSERRDSTQEEIARAKAGKPAPRFSEVDKVALMESHYVAAITAHDMLIRNDLDGFRTKLAELAKQQLPASAPRSWRARHKHMQEAARAASDVSNVDEAGAVMASLVETCGECHAVLIGGPIYEKPEASRGTDPVQVTMRKHQWATERLWEGVTGPWDDAWLRGSEAIANAELFSQATAASPALRDLEKALRALGREAKHAAALSDRAKLYGRLLAGCAHCHDLAKVPLAGR